MAECFLAQSGGGGASLNFKVKDYATEEQLMAATGKDNEIGIITSTPMTGWYMASEQPENMKPGEAWIFTGTSSTVAFNAAKKGVVMVYPIEAKQMGNEGALVDVTAKSWQDGQWVDWFIWDGELYDSGNEFEKWTGGWTTIGQSVGGDFPSDMLLNITRNADSITFTLSGSGTISSYACIGKHLDLTDYSTFSVDVKSASGNYALWIVDEKDARIANADKTGSGTKEISLSGVNQKCRVGLALWYNSTVTITKAKLLK